MCGLEERESCEGGGRVEGESVVSHWLIAKRCPAHVIFCQEYDKYCEHFRETPLLLNSYDMGSEDGWVEAVSSLHGRSQALLPSPADFLRSWLMDSFREIYSSVCFFYYFTLILFSIPVTESPPHMSDNTMFHDQNTAEGCWQAAYPFRGILSSTQLPLFSVITLRL